MPPASLQRKIVSRAQLLERVGQARQQGQTVVQCHGCFDIVHPGHIRYLEFARRQGDLLVVSLTGDPNIAKGDHRPYVPEELRAESLAALECVDLVHVDPNDSAEEILDDVRPDVYVKGAEYQQSRDPRFLRESEVVERNGGRVIFSSGEVVFSSSTLIDTLPKNPDFEYHHLQGIARRHGITRKSLDDTLSRFMDLRVLIVGDIVIDRYVFCDAIDVASEAPMMSLTKLDEDYYVGGAAIVARHVAALGADALLLTAVADDEQSAVVEDTLRREGIQLHLLRNRPKLAEKIRFLVDENKILKVESAEHVPLDSVAERWATAIIDQFASNVDALIFCDFGYGMITGGLIEHATARLRRSVRTIAADVSSPRANLLNFRNVDLLCPTERELRSNLNDYDRGLSAAAHTLLAKTQARHLFVTLQKKGLVVFDRPSQDPESPQWSARLLSEHLPSFVDRPIDCLGGGDALLATASLALASGSGLLPAAYLGNAAAAFEIARLGNVPLDAPALRRWVHHQTHLADAPPEPALSPAGDHAGVC